MEGSAAQPHKSKQSAAVIRAVRRNPGDEDHRAEQ
jgi:hypothetical protein